MTRITTVALSLLIFSACSYPTSGPDKTAGEAVMGAAWGAGAGAIVGNQLDAPGEGAAIGAGIGLASGALSGASADIVESAQLREEEDLKALQIENLTNARKMATIQRDLDRKASLGSGFSGFYQVFFDPDTTNLKTGAIANLEVIADAIKASTSTANIKVVGHSDDAGTPDYNRSIAESRARSVAGYLAARGISLSQIKIESRGSELPLASNSTDVGRQLNRRVDIYVSR